PLTLAVARIECEQAAVGTAHHDDIAGDDRRDQNFARHARAPQYAAVVVERDHHAFARADHHQFAVAADAAGQAIADVDTPDFLAGLLLRAHHRAVISGGIDTAARNRRRERKALARPDARLPKRAHLQRLGNLRQRNGLARLVAAAEPVEGIERRATAERHDQREPGRAAAKHA